MAKTHKEGYQDEFAKLDSIRLYRFGVTDSLDKLVKGYETKFGPDKMDFAHYHKKKYRKRVKKANRDLRLLSLGYLEAVRDIFDYLEVVNGQQLDSLREFAKWQENELARWETVEMEFTGWEED